MIALNLIILSSIFIFGIFCQSLDSPCVLKSTGASGKCKLIIDCPQISTEIFTRDLIPQECGIQGTQTVVCCPLRRKRPGQISKEKCREYSSYAYKDASGGLTPEKTCGHTIVKRIVGGHKASGKEFAHMVIIGFQKGTEDVRWLCGGTLISNQYVLTSAKCKGGDLEGEAKFVKLGITDLNDNDKKQEFKIAEFIQHPDYHRRLVYNDIALIKLDKPITLHSHARPACLYTKEVISAEKGIATGWGTTSSRGERSDHLLKVSLDLVTHQFCNESFPIYRKLPRGIDQDTQICAGSGVEQKDTCQGDSGGPLQIYHSDDDDIECMYDIIGITSFGKGCSGSPGVYTKVSHYVKWIEDIVWPA